MEKALQNDLLDGADSAAEFTGLTRRKIYRLVDEGRIPHTRKGRRLYFRRSELERAFTAKSEHSQSHTRKLSLNGFSATGYIKRRKC
ncbi:helix-turn-helix domain-containing protein [Erythrobacter aquimaris]|uniref:Helix-turn-helix domain-containing protein n=1 Tax=Qipengyuania aquimaris TaxID=255984 RepID=A0A6I4TN30_9SPHN|nr:helix-turn-helix domain-containing protein [Qipengyuania aquimaris]